MAEKRYIADFDLYIFADNDEQAKETTQKITELINEYYPDANVSISGLTEAPFGKTKDNFREIKL